MSDLQLVVGGVRVTSVGAVGDLTRSQGWGGGCKEASWEMTATYGTRRAPFIRGASVILYCGSWPVWRGTLNEPEWAGDSVSFTAGGLSRLGENFFNFANATTLTTTTNPTTAIGVNQPLGLPWTVGTGIPNANLAAPTTDPVNSLTALLDEHARVNAMRWGVDAFGVATMAADPTVPTFFTAAGVGDLGIADDNYASHVILNHKTTTGTYRRAVYPALNTTNAYSAMYGIKHYVRDITDQGIIPNATADALAQQVYTLAKQRPGWTNGLEVPAGQLLTAGGEVASLDLFVEKVGKGVMVQLQGIRDEVANTSYTNIIVQDATHVAGAQTVSFNPVGLVSRDPESVLTELLEAKAATAA